MPYKNKEQQRLWTREAMARIRAEQRGARPREISPERLIEFIKHFDEEEMNKIAERNGYPYRSAEYQNVTTYIYKLRNRVLYREMALLAKNAPKELLFKYIDYLNEALAKFKAAQEKAQPGSKEFKLYAKLIEIRIERIERMRKATQGNSSPEAKAEA